MLPSKDIVEWQTRLQTRAYKMLPTRDSPQAKNRYKLKVRGWKKIFHGNGKDRTAGTVTLMSDEIDLKVHKDKEGHYLMIK